MFRRRQKSKNSSSLGSSNRGSDIVKPENSSLIVNESGPEADGLPKELTSVLSEDEDESLRSINRTSSSFMKSFSQKTQSTPLSLGLSQKKNLRTTEKHRKQKVKPLSNSEKKSFFEKILKAGGAVPLPANSSFLMNEDQTMFSIKINNALKENSLFLKKFMDSIKEVIKDTEMLHKMLAHTLTAENCEVARGPVQEPLIRLLLNVECLQTDLIQLLLDTVADLVVDNKAEDGDAQLVSSIIRQMRFLNRATDMKITSKLFEIINIAAVNIQREIIFMIPELISDREIEETCVQLTGLLKFDEALTSTIVDALANLPLNQALRCKICSKILQRLDKCPLEFLPSLVHFVLNKCHAGELHEVVEGLRKGLPFTLEHLQMKKSENRDEKISLEEDVFVKLTFENLKFSAMASKELTDAWIKVINSLNSSASFRCVDLIMLIIFYSSLFGRKGQILNLIRSKIKCAILTQVHVENMFKILVIIAEEYCSTILEMASAFFTSLDPRISNFGALLYKKCFIHFHFFMKQIVISEILIHVGTGNTVTINTALNTLEELCENEIEALSKHTTCIMGLLVKIQDLELRHVRLLIDIIASLVFFESSGRETAAQDELLIFTRKQLISSKLDQRKKGVSAAITLSKHYAKKDDCDDCDWTQINLLLELAMGMNGASEAKRGFFNDEFATMITESQLSKSFLQIWREKIYSLAVENIFVKDINMNCEDFPASLQYGLQDEETEKFVFPVIEFVKSNDSFCRNIPTSVIPSTLRLLWCLEKKKRILPAFLASVFMPETTVYDNFNSFDDSQKKEILNCLFLCGNYLIESINALCAQGFLKKALLRVKQLIRIRELLSNHINFIREFAPPICQFHAPAQSVFVKTKTSEKKVKRGKKRKLEEVEMESQNPPEESMHSLENTTTCSKEDIFVAEKSGQRADLHQYSLFFRELDFGSFKLLATDLESVEDSELLKRSKGTNYEFEQKLDTSDFLFLLEDLLCKAEQILKTSEVTSYFKIKSLDVPLRKMTPKDFVLASVQVMPRLLDKIEIFSKYCENLLEANDWICDSRGLYVQGACQIKLSMAAGFKFIAEIMSWLAYQNSNNKLLKDFLVTLARRGNSSGGNLKVDSLVTLALDAANYLATFKKTILVLSGGLSIVKFFQACVRYSSFESCCDLADLCREFLCRKWYTVTGDEEKGSEYNQHVDFLLKTYFSFVENKLETICSTAKTALAEMEGFSGKDFTLKTFKTIKKSNFTLLYRTVCAALTSASGNEFSKAEGDNEKQLDLWNKVVETLLILVEIAKIHSTRAILASLLKRSQSIIQLFLSKAMPLVESALRVKSDEVLTLLKSFQLVTRFLHFVCCQSRISNDSVLAAHVPIIRSQCERLTLEVKGMIILNGIPKDYVTIAVLKNRDIKGNDIISQETLDEDSEDDSELPPEDTPDPEENLNELLNEETLESNSETY